MPMSTTPKADHHHAAADDGIICEEKRAHSANYSPTFPCSIGGLHAIGSNEEQIGREQFASLKPPGRWSVASTNAVRHLLIQHEDNSTSRQFNKKQLNKIQLNYLPTEHIAIQQVLFQQHPSLNFRTTQQMQPPCSGKIRMSFQVQIWLANSKISCKIA